MHDNENNIQSSIIREELIKELCKHQVEIAALLNLSFGSLTVKYEKHRPVNVQITYSIGGDVLKKHID